MYEIIKSLHSLWAYFVLIVLFLSTINSWMGLSGKKEFGNKDFRISLFALIFTHIQVLLGMAIYFMSPYYMAAKQVGMGAAMKDSTLRLYVVEHPLVMILSVILITIGFSKHKKKETAEDKLKTIRLFYTLALALLLTRLPWAVWLG